MFLTSRDALIEAMRAAGNDRRPLSCSELARRAGCSKAMVGHLRSGKINKCSPKLAAEIERGLGVNSGALFTPTQSERIAS